MSNIGTTPLGALILGSPGTASTAPQPTPDGLYVVSFTAVNPPLRNDGNAWTTLQISEAAGQAGPWTTIDTQPLTPVDADPSQPAERNFTTSKATLSEGFYSLTFFDAAGGSSHPLVQIQDNPSAILPSLSDLGSFMRARTVAINSGGGELGTFTANTRPTAMEAESLLEQASSQVLMAVGQEIPDNAIQQARFLVLLYAAQLVELTFYRNEVNRDQSAYQQYVDLYKDGIASLTRFISNDGPAAPEASFWSVPVLNGPQARFQAYVGAMDLQNGTFDPTKLPPEYWYPMGPGGIPPQLIDFWPWLGGNGITAGQDWLMTDLESDG